MTDEHNKHNQKTEERIVSDVKEYGFHIGLIGEDDYLPGFAYTIGLYQTYRHPEIICFGLKPNVLGVILNHAGDLIKGDTSLAAGRLYAGFLEGYQVQFLPVREEHYPDYLGYAGWFYQGWEFPVLQLLWPDKGQLFPWEPGFNPNWKFKQPLLDRNVDFRFYEDGNLGVYTTKHFLEGSSILFVYHNEDGDWQFHTEDNPQPEDGIVVCLEDITRRDPSVNEGYYLPYGGIAWRESPVDPWQVETAE
jgi:hypothetical protein